MQSGDRKVPGQQAKKHTAAATTAPERQRSAPGLQPGGTFLKGRGGPTSPSPGATHHEAARGAGWCMPYPKPATKQLRNERRGGKSTIFEAKLFAEKYSPPQKKESRERPVWEWGECPYLRNCRSSTSIPINALFEGEGRGERLLPATT